MNNARLRRILTILDTTISLHPLKRPDYLTMICGQDEKLRHEVQTLLESAERSETFWKEWERLNEQQIQALLQGEFHEEFIELKQIGAWQLVKLLGRGGMGSVFLAERADGQYEQQAVLKLLHQGLAFGEVVRRFAQERQLLARMDHPNIARLYDGGITGDGCPWLVMEYVNGVSISDWCRKRRCSLTQRIALFEQVCSAVQYAHKNLIVHRDLKPANILVTEEGRVKVLDFGIAKLLDEKLSGAQRIQTQTGLRMMSLDYAAPEQITGEPVTTATDVYALGMLLYELLAGSYPFDLKDKNRQQIEHILLMNDPARPSLLPAPWYTELKGDLDAIILKALRKEPEQRYENVRQLLEDIWRYRSSLPVSARSDTWRYRSRKFFQRNRTTITAGIAILIGIASVITYYTYRVTRERDAAALEARRANQVTDFLISIFEYSNPTAEHSNDITAREILDESIPSIREKLKNQPATRARLFDAMGQIYQNLGLLDKARPLYLEALHIGREYAGQEHPDTVRLAFIYTHYGNLLRDMGKYDSSSTYLNRAVALYQRDRNVAKLATSLESLGWVVFLKGHYDEADSIYRRTLKIREKLNGKNSLEYASLLQQIGWLEQYRGHSKTADSLFRLILPVRKKYQGETHQDVATLLHSLGWTSYKLGHYEEAIRFNEEALALRKKIFGEQHPDVAWTLNNLGVIHLGYHHSELAESLLTESLTMRRALLGEVHPQTMQTLGNLARVYYFQKKYRKAATLYRQVLSTHKKALGDAHPMLVADLNNLSMVLDKAGDREQALALASQAVSLGEHIYDEAHPTLIAIMRNKADLLEKLNRYEEAEPLRVSCFERIRRAKGMQDTVTRQMLGELILFYRKWNKPEESARYIALQANSR